jgi:hypothetical protein
MTSDTVSSVRFHAHKNLARKNINAARILSLQQFSRVDWEIVHSALITVPRMFQVWACKQVWGIAGTSCAPAAGKHLKRAAMFYIALMMAK